MSLVLFKSDKDLLSTLDEATRSNDIVMLCSTADDGNNYQEVWPAHHGDVIGIAACNSFGKLMQWSNPTHSNYEFQGVDILTPVDGDGKSLPSRVPVSGSSVATAMGTGVTSLLLSCYRMYELSQQRPARVPLKGRLHTSTGPDSPDLQAQACQAPELPHRGMPLIMFLLDFKELTVCSENTAGESRTETECCCKGHPQQ
jgi:hypothetical protein